MGATSHLLASYILYICRTLYRYTEYHTILSSICIHPCTVVPETNLRLLYFISYCIVLLYLVGVYQTFLATGDERTIYILGKMESRGIFEVVRNNNLQFDIAIVRWIKRRKSTVVSCVMISLYQEFTRIACHMPQRLCVSI